MGTPGTCSGRQRGLWEGGSPEHRVKRGSWAVQVEVLCSFSTSDKAAPAVLGLPERFEAGYLPLGRRSGRGPEPPPAPQVPSPPLLDPRAQGAEKAAGCAGSSGYWVAPSAWLTSPLSSPESLLDAFGELFDISLKEAETASKGANPHPHPWTGLIAFWDPLVALHLFYPSLSLLPSFRENGRQMLGL